MNPKESIKISDELQAYEVARRSRKTREGRNNGLSGSSNLEVSFRVQLTFAKKRDGRILVTGAFRKYIYVYKTEGERERIGAICTLRFWVSYLCWE